MIQYQINCGQNNSRILVEISPNGSWKIAADITEEERRNALPAIAATAAGILRDGMILRDAILETMKTMELAIKDWDFENSIGHQSSIAQHMRRDHAKLKKLTTPK